MKLLRQFILVATIFGGVLFISAPIFAQMTEEYAARCWTEDDCVTKYHGIWGRGPEYKAKYSPDGQADSWSVTYCKGPPGAPALARCFTGHPNVPLQVGIPGVTGGVCSRIDDSGSFPTCDTIGQACGKDDRGVCQVGIQGGFPGYMAAFYKFFIAALAVIAIVMVMWGGFKRIMAAGSPERIKSANETIIGAITGVIIALISYSLLNLVNPQLVANTLPLIEKVKPESFGFCPKYSENKSAYDIGYTEASGKCEGGTKNGGFCLGDGHCPGGKCTGMGTNKVGNPGDYTCGMKLIVQDNECTAIECPEDQGGCFPNNIDFPKYACKNYLVQGNIQGIETNWIDLVPVCNDNSFPLILPDHQLDRSGCFVNKAEPLGVKQDSHDVEDKSSYVIGDCYDPFGTGRVRNSACAGSKGGIKGFALIIEVEGTGSTADDWYGIDRKSCGASVSKRIVDSDGNDAPRNVLLSSYLNYSRISADSLFKLEFNDDKCVGGSNNGDICTSNSDCPSGSCVAGSVKTPIQCDLNITRTEFPDR